MATKTLQQITNEIIQKMIAAFSPRLVDTRIGTVMREAIINPFSEQVNGGYARIDTVELNQSVINAESMTVEAMDNMAANFGKTRFGGSSAVGFVRLAKFVSPTVIINIPAGTNIGTKSANDSDRRLFKTLSAVQLLPSSPADPLSGAAAYVDVFVRSNNVGAIDNVDAGTVTELLDPILGIDLVYNPQPLQNGKDVQTNLELAATVQTGSQGRLGTRPGYKDLVTSNFSVQDVLVVGKNDIEVSRNQFGGSVDIVVLGQEPATATETYVYTGQTRLDITLKPLISATSLTGFDALDVPITLQGPASGVGLGVDFDVILDTTGPLSGSYTENAYINLHPVTVTPGVGKLLSLVYTNNQLIRTIQSFVALEDNEVLAADVLVRAGTKINADITAQISVVPGFDSTAVIADATNRVTSFFDALILDVDVQASDVIAVIADTPGIDYVDIPTFILAKSDFPAVPVQEIIANKQGYIRAQLITITVL